jgi:hypothetical protein
VEKKKVETYLQKNNLPNFSSKMFLIWDGNHCFKAWYESKAKEFSCVDFHIEPATIVLDG